MSVVIKKSMPGKSAGFSPEVRYLLLPASTGSTREQGYVVVKVHICPFNVQKAPGSSAPGVGVSTR